MITIKEIENFYRNIIEFQSVDISFESFLSILCHSSIDCANSFHVIPNEFHNRNFRNDIVKAPEETSYGKDQYFIGSIDSFVQLYTSRTSILGHLPEFFYAEADNSSEYVDLDGNRRSPSEREEYRRQRSERMKDARTFFIPLEILFNRFRIHKGIKELIFSKNSDTFLGHLWGKTFCSDSRWIRYIRTRHLVTEIIGNLEKTETLISYVLDLPIQLTIQNNTSFQCSTDKILDINGGQRILGHSVFLGDIIYDYHETCELRIQLRSQDIFMDYFLKEGKGYQLLAEIIDHYFPIDILVEKKLEIRADATTEGTPILGYSTRLLTQLDHEIIN